MLILIFPKSVYHQFVYYFHHLHCEVTRLRSQLLSVEQNANAPGFGREDIEIMKSEALPKPFIPCSDIVQPYR